MNIIGTWFFTVCLSFYFEVKSAFKMFKDFADAGYKFNSDKLSELSNAVGPMQARTIFSLFVPFYNMLSTVVRFQKYEQFKEVIFEQYITLGILEEMSDEEKAEYNKKSTGFNASVIAAKGNVKNVNDYMTLTIKENDNDISIVKFNINEKADNLYDKLDIIEISGPISNLTKNEQLDIIVDCLRKMVLSEDNIISENENTNKNETESNVEDKQAEEVKPLSRLERYKQLRDSITENGYLYGEEMVEYKELQEEFGNQLTLSI